MMHALPVLQAVAVAFPDEGAKKRFGGFFEKAGYPVSSSGDGPMTKCPLGLQFEVLPLTLLGRSSSAAKYAKERRE